MKLNWICHPETILTYTALVIFALLSVFLALQVGIFTRTRYLLIINYILHNNSSMQQRAGCTATVIENLTESLCLCFEPLYLSLFFLWQLSLWHLCGPAWVKHYNHSKDVRYTREKKVNSLWCKESNLMRGEEDGGIGWGWMLWGGGRGPHPTCMNSRIRAGIVLRAKSCCVPFSCITSQPVHGRFSKWLSFYSSRERHCCGLCFYKHNTNIVTP